MGAGLASGVEVGMGAGLASGVEVGMGAGLASGVGAEGLSSSTTAASTSPLAGGSAVGEAGAF